MRVFKLLLLSLVLSALARPLNAQNFETPVQYMEYIYKATDALSAKYFAYISAVSHSKSARKVEKKRQEVLNAIIDTRVNIMGMPPYKGDRALKDTTVEYLKVLNSIFNEDYGKIVNLEQIAEQSYDAMEAYIMAQEKANERLLQIQERQQRVQREFARKNNVTLVDGEETALQKKMKVVDKVMTHYDKVYLIFFKCNVQEGYLVEAINKKNTSAIEQALSSLGTFAEEGLEKLKAVEPYDNDPQLIKACEAALQFFKQESGNGSAFSDYYLKQEAFTKLKKQFDSKPASKRTQEDVDQFNKAVDEINKSGESFNRLSAEMEKSRTAVINGWNKTVEKFLDTHIPR